MSRSRQASIVLLALLAGGCEQRRLTSACNSGDGAACATLAETFSPGAHPPGDAAEWRRLHKRACESGAFASCQTLARGAPDIEPVEAMALLDRGCKGGFLPACNDRAMRLEDGAERTELFRRACDGGVDLACSNLGVLLVEGRGAAKDVTGAIGLFDRACEHGEPIGCHNRANAYKEGVGGPADEIRAAELYQRACDLGHPAGCDGLGSLQLKRGNEGPAYTAFKRGCEAATSGALGTPSEKGAVCWRLALSYLRGLGVAPDEAQAVATFNVACDFGNGEACQELGLREKAKDAARAVGHFQKACDAGVAGGCNNVALMYSLGLGVARDGPRAAGLFEKACEMGEANACANLGDRYRRGDGVPIDVKRGLELLSRACAAGIADACHDAR